MKLSTWVRQARVRPRTAYCWFHAGRLPVAARRLGTGAILVDPPAQDDGDVAVYARVSSADQRADLGRRVAGVVGHATSLAVQGRRSVVLGDGEVGDDLVGGMVEVGTSVCARLCGLGSACRRAQRAVEAVGEVAA